MRSFFEGIKALRETKSLSVFIWRVHEYPSYKRGGIDVYTYKIPFHYS
jgi:hypothetical protein